MVNSWRNLYTIHPGYLVCPSLNHGYLNKRNSLWYQTVQLEPEDTKQQQ